MRGLMGVADWLASGGALSIMSCAWWLEQILSLLAQAE